MIAVSVDLRGFEKLLKLQSRTQNIKSTLSSSWHRSAKYVVNYIQQQMSATPRGADGRSLPGNFPAVQTGALQASIRYAVYGWSEFHVGTNMNYASYLELGTSKMSQRPFLRPGAERSIARVERLLVSDLSKLFKI